MHRSPLYITVSSLFLLLCAAVATIAAKTRAAFDRQVPVGYQDEEGFHLGIRSADNTTGLDRVE